MSPLTGLPARTRLRAAGVLCLLPLGLVWGPGAGQGARGSQVPARVFLAFAAVVFLVAAARTRTRTTKRAVRAAIAAVAIGLALALSARAVPAAGCLVAAATLVYPLIRPRKPGVFVPAPVRR